MARRRRLQGMGAGLAGGLQDMLMMMYQNQMIQSRQRESQHAGEQKSVLDEIDKLSDPALVQQNGPEAMAGRLGVLRRRLDPANSAKVGDIDFTQMDRPAPMRMAPVQKRVAEFDKSENAPTAPELENMLGAARVPAHQITGEAGEPLDVDPITAKSDTLSQLMAQVQQRVGGLKAAQPGIATPSNTGPGGSQVTRYLTPEEQRAAGPLPTERTPEQTAALAGGTAKATALGTAEGQEQGAAESFDAKLARTKKEYSAMTPLEVSRAARQASAESDAKLPNELKLISARGAQELVLAGQKAKADELVKSQVAVERLLPIYTTYRQLALDVSGSWAGAGSPTAGAAVSTVGKVPIIGGLAESALESAQAGIANVGDPELAKKISELNRLRSTLAQGMANAVLGNRGQTTENDRKTAEAILAGSFNDTATVKSLLELTDGMFKILPTISAQNPEASRADVLTLAAKAAGLPAPGAAGAAQQSDALKAAMEILNGR